jgi:hypothetical protein
MVGAALATMALPASACCQSDEQLADLLRDDHTEAFVR